MAEITASMVKELREMTGAGMMDCKKALNETGGNMDEAVEVLRKSGQAKKYGFEKGSGYPSRCHFQIHIHVPTKSIILSKS